MTQEQHALPDDWELEEVPCDFCGDTEAEPFLKGKDWLHGLPGEFQVVRCRTCGLARTNPRPTASALSAAYPESYVSFRSSQRPEQAPKGFRRWALVNYRDYPLGRKAPPLVRTLLRPLADRVLRKRKNVGYFPHRGEGRLLDFGCGPGKYVARMNAAGWRAEGLDLSEHAVRQATEAGLTVHLGTLPGVELPKDRYDLVTMWQAIEHVPSPKATLAAIRDALKPDGRLAVVCPRLDSVPAEKFGALWYGLDLPRHLTHFTRETLCRHVEASGYDVLQFRSVRRTGRMQQSYRRRAEVTGRPWHRATARLRWIPRLMSHLSYWTGRTEEMLCIARPKE